MATRENGKAPMLSDSVSSKWVHEEEDEEKDDDDVIRFNLGGDDDDDDDDEELYGEEKPPRLVRTGPDIDPLDMEALEISEAHKEEMLDQEFDLRKGVILTLQILAVVFGDVGTSPLYTFDVMFNNSPIQGKDDVLGALSLVLYTLILIPLVKNAKVRLIPNQLQAGNRMSSFRLKVPSPELERSLKIKERLEASFMLKKLLLMLVLFGTSMVISGGAVTPAMSVISAVSGLKVGIPSIEQDNIVMISVAFLMILFSVQRFATSKIGLVIGPALFIWFCSLGGIGIYNLVKHGFTVFSAFNPMYIVMFFKRNSTKAWMSLGGCLLCATGSEAMFADLCYFSVRSIQLTFSLLVLPCLMLGYLGQAAFLMNNQHASEQVFFSSIPSGAFWPIFIIANVAAVIASRAMITATFSCIKQSMTLGCFPRLKIIHPSRKFMGHIYIPTINWFLLLSCLAFVATFRNMNEMGNAYGISEIGVMVMTTILATIIMLLIWQTYILFVLLFVTLFLGLELVFFSSVLVGVGNGSWIMLGFAATLFVIMMIWNYGSRLKYETEVNQKLPMDLLKELGCNLGTVRAPGIGLVYNELVKGVPAIFGHLLTTLPAIHSMIVFVSIVYVPVPVVPQSGRFLFRRVCPRSYHMFRCIARYGYKDVRKESHHAFEQLLVSSLEKFIQREAQERSLQSDDDIDSDADEGESHSRIFVAPSGSMYSLSTPLLADFDKCLRRPAPEASTSSRWEGEGAISDVGKNLEMELSVLNHAKEMGIVYLLAHGDIRAKKDSWFWKKLAINYFYSFLKKNCQREITMVSVPRTNLMRISMTYMV